MEQHEPAFRLQPAHDSSDDESRVAEPRAALQQTHIVMSPNFGSGVGFPLEWGTIVAG